MSTEFGGPGDTGRSLLPVPTHIDGELPLRKTAENSAVLAAWGLAH
jgi:hypothetical protein